MGPELPSGLGTDRTRPAAEGRYGCEEIVDRAAAFQGRAAACEEMDQRTERSVAFSDNSG